MAGKAVGGPVKRGLFGAARNEAFEQPVGTQKDLPLGFWNGDGKNN
jgi:hypothetical protein